MAEDLIDQFLDGLKQAVVDFGTNFVEERIAPPHQKQPRARRVTTKVPKAKKAKAEKAAKPAARTFEQTHYETLEVIRGASPETVSAAFRSLCQRNHPDKYPNDARARKHAEERTKAFTEAYAVLKDPTKRKAYDAELKARNAR